MKTLALLVRSLPPYDTDFDKFQLGAMLMDVLWCFNSRCYTYRCHHSLMLNSHLSLCYNYFLYNPVQFIIQDLSQ